MNKAGNICLNEIGETQKNKCLMYLHECESCKRWPPTIRRYNSDSYRLGRVEGKRRDVGYILDSKIQLDRNNKFSIVQHSNVNKFTTICYYILWRTRDSNLEVSQCKGKKKGERNVNYSEWFIMSCVDLLVMKYSWIKRVTIVNI